MATVLTVSMTLRIILSVRGSLVMGGSFALSSSVGESARSTQIISGRSSIPINGSAQPNTFTLDDLRTKPEGDWVVPDTMSSINIVADRKNDLVPDSREVAETTMAVKVTIDRDTTWKWSKIVVCEYRCGLSFGFIWLLLFSYPLSRRAVLLLVGRTNCKNMQLTQSPWWV